MQTKVGFYGRISDDPNNTLAGIERQREDCIGIAKARQWVIVHEYIDNDISAYKRGVVRPEFERLLVDLRGGKIDGVVVYDLDRFVRQSRDLERALDIYSDEKVRSLVFASAQGDINLQSDDGKVMARVMVAFANKSSSDTGRRTARKHLELARAGKPVGGRRPFGWKDDKATLEPREVALVREAVDDLVAGASIRSIIRRWNADGVLTTSGKQWNQATLRRYLRNPRLIGHRTHKGVVLHDEHGHPVKGLWEPLLSVDQFDRVAQVLQRPDKRSRVPRRGARHYLLTGLVRCGTCTGVMYGSRTREGRHNYVCDTEQTPRHRLSISGVALDEAVRDLVLAKMANADLGTKKPATKWPREAELKDVGDQIDELMAAFRAKRLSGEVVFPMVEALEEERAELRNDRAQWLVTTIGPVVSRLDRAGWDAIEDVDKKRAIIEQWLSAVLIVPITQRQGNRFDHERVVPVWKGDVPAPPVVPL